MNRTDSSLIEIARKVARYPAAPEYVAALVAEGLPTLVREEAVVAADDLGLRLLSMGRIEDAGRLLRLARTLRARELDLV